MAIIVLYGTYTAAITSELSDIQVHMPFLNLHQMYTETETKVGTVKGTVITEIFKVSKMLADHTVPFVCFCCLQFRCFLQWCELEEIVVEKE